LPRSSCTASAPMAAAEALRGSSSAVARRAPPYRPQRRWAEGCGVLLQHRRQRRRFECCEAPVHALHAREPAMRGSPRFDPIGPQFVSQTLDSCNSRNVVTKHPRRPSIVLRPRAGNLPKRECPSSRTHGLCGSRESASAGRFCWRLLGTGGSASPIR
jgi:hypothetical protein